MWHMGDGQGWWMVFGMLMMAGFWIAIIWGAVTLTRCPHGRSDALPREPTAVEILERRYASGELSDEEFETRKRKLLG